MSYFNTTNLFSEELKNVTFKALKQDEAVLCILREVKTHLEASEIHARYEKYYLKTVPLTSIRRSCSTLKKAGLLKMVKIKKMGSFGVPCNQYQIV
jgi:Fe2+ or Zn2+ uptake regulation protein